ncbi:hypothetical protein PNOK_0506000 [Pyrrhoderma noxium]|uniref:T6SS Phospholipase effector Tle1-like catalytic domain-containing protein n=1 Tax=Pyrrhoderma noxium TaxID=2282107 RepID=A0A286UKH9_9AGAM|nr:hypothetical protein PNOK_0506000 [Pyrrhoderma noxium]
MSRLSTSSSRDDVHVSYCASSIIAYRKYQTAMATSKMLLVFCDGTGMDGNLSDNSATDSNTTTAEPLGGDSSAQNATNVLRLSRAVQSLSTDGRRQIVFYQSGVGSEADFAGEAVNGTTVLQALGTAVASKIRDAYAFIAQNFEDGDEICIFGFSRGAYTARKVAGLIDRIGLLQREDLGQFFQIWKSLNDGVDPTIPSGTRTTNIKCVGVWDTVGSVYGTIDALNIKDTSLPATIDVALHALALQENRESFLPTLWTLPESNKVKRGNDTQVLKQIWFAGAHSDVGGGYDRHELADIALFWMAGEIASFINLDLDFIRASAQTNPDPWGTSQPHNAYDELSIAEKPIIGEENRLESGDITSDAQFHQSVLVAPTQLDNDSYMITLDTIREQFGASWAPDCPPLNAFEELCKNFWGVPVSRGDLGPVVFETPSQLFS